MRKSYITGSLVVSVILFFVACGNQEESNAASTSSKSEVKEDNKKADKAAVRDVSELADLMRVMHDELKDARKFVADSSSIPDSVWTDFAHMVTAESTDGMIKDQDHFNGYAQLFLNRVSELKENPDVEKYNAVVDNCVACHQQYCQGPISKIKKLSLPVK